MASHVAASAFGHCLAMVRDERAAAELAAVALRRGGRGLGNVLGHARHQALAAVASAPPPPLELAPDAGPSDVAWALAASRPPLELAMIDLSGRYGLRRAGLGVALGLPPAAAAARVAAVGQEWDAALDPALLAWLGPGECEELAAVLDGRPRAGASDLLALAGEIADHTAGCDLCGDRQRAMASVRRLVASTPLPVPPESMVTAARSRVQPTVPAPPLVGGRPHFPTRVLSAVVLAMVVAGVAGAVAQSRRGDDPEPASVQATLTDLPTSAGTLELLPTTLELSAAEVSLLNTSDDDVAWEADADAAWLDVTPPRGVLAPGREQVLRLSGTPPEGEVRTAVRVAGDDGSAAATTLSGTVEHPPDLGASAEGCLVTAVVEDETAVVLTLHARDAAGAETRTPMAVSDTTAQGTLLPGTALTWWVSAVDGRGNQARTADVALPTGC